MIVYVFGNPDHPQDNIALTVMGVLNTKIPGLEFVAVSPNEDLPFAGEPHVVIMDAIAGITEVVVLDDISRLSLSPTVSVHDYDLGFQLKYLKKLGKLSRVTIIGLPMEKPVDYDLIQSILRKLVAQETQGS